MFVFLLSYVMFWVMRGQARMSLLLLHDQNRIEANTPDTGGWGPVWVNQLIKGISHSSKGVTQR